MVVEALTVRLLQFVLVPLEIVDVRWAVAPLLFTLLFTQMYFGKYKTEEIGWNTAFSNTLSLVWVTFILLRHVENWYGLSYAINAPELQGHMLLLAALILLTSMLSYCNFEHLLRKRFAFILSSAIPTSVIAYLSLVIIIGGIPFDSITLAAGAIFFLLIDITFRCYRRAITSPVYVEKTLERREKERKKEIRKIKRKVKTKAKKLLK